jgi:hypothetical protein
MNAKWERCVSGMRCRCTSPPAAFDFAQGAQRLLMLHEAIDGHVVRRFCSGNASLAAVVIQVNAPDREFRRSLEFALEAEGFSVDSHALVAGAEASPTASEAVCAVVDEGALRVDPARRRSLDRLIKPVELLADGFSSIEEVSGLVVLIKPLQGNGLFVEQSGNVVDAEHLGHGSDQAASAQMPVTLAMIGGSPHRHNKLSSLRLLAGVSTKTRQQLQRLLACQVFAPISGPRWAPS